MHYNSGIGYYVCTLNMYYDFGSAGSGSVRVETQRPDGSSYGWGFEAASGSGNYSCVVYGTGTWHYWAQLKYGTTVIEGAHLAVTFP
jgi:hypothetical protein